MKISELKTAVKEAAAQNEEAFNEIGAKIAELQKQIDDLIAGNSDPDITDEAFANDLTKLQRSAKQLADIVPGPDTPPEEPPAEDGTVPVGTPSNR